MNPFISENIAKTNCCLEINNKITFAILCFKAILL